MGVMYKISQNGGFIWFYMVLYVFVYGFIWFLIGTVMG